MWALLQLFLWGWGCPWRGCNDPHKVWTQDGSSPGSSSQKIGRQHLNLNVLTPKFPALCSSYFTPTELLGLYPLAGGGGGCLWGSRCSKSINCSFPTALIKARHTQTNITLNSTLRGRKGFFFPLKIANKARMSILTIPQTTGCSNHCNKARKEIKDIRTGREEIRIHKTFWTY